MYKLLMWENIFADKLIHKPLFFFSFKTGRIPEREYINSHAKSNWFRNVFTTSAKAGRKPIFKKRLKEQSVTEGSSVTLECTVEDALSVAWYKDAIIQRNSSDFKQTFDNTSAKLEISEIFLDDKGEYSCIAKNECGEAKSSCKIFVKGNKNSLYIWYHVFFRGKQSLF